jgi:hypothetical protein
MKLKIILVASLGLIGCGDKGLDLIEIGPSDASTSSTNGETSDSSDADWPECLPWSSSVSFVVAPGTLEHPDTNWPAGHHEATCIVDSTEVQWVDDGVLQLSIELRECQDEDALPITMSLDLWLSSLAVIEPPPGIEVDQSVRVSYSVMLWPELIRADWYSLRDAETDELLLAAFADYGSSVAPKVDGMVDGENWLAPFEATLGAFGCAPEQNVGCSDGAAQRAFVEFTRDGSTGDVLGGTEADLGDYQVHLGFAGTPGYCEGRPTHHAIEGILVRKL